MAKTKNRGFTLIELLVVIAIIGLLSVIAVVALNSTRAKARDAKRLADLKQVQTAVELYIANNNIAPKCPLGTDPQRCATYVYSNFGNFTDLQIKDKEMPNIPIDPKNNLGGTGYGYVYGSACKKTGQCSFSCTGNTDKDYVIAAKLEGSTGCTVTIGGLTNANYLLGSQ